MTRLFAGSGSRCPWKWRCAAGAFVVALLLAAHGAIARGDDDASAGDAASRDEIAKAALSGLTVVSRGADNYPNNRKCFSCHHQTLPMLAVVEARRAGLKVDEELLSRQAQFTHESFQGRIESLREGKGIGGAAMTVSYGLWALELAGAEADETTEAMVEFLLRTQHDDGQWPLQANRPPLETSKQTCAVLAAYYMQKFAAPDQQEQIDKAVAKARSFVESAKCESQEDLNARLMAANLLGGEQKQRDEWKAAVLAAQRDDGGWSQLPDMESDAYATGQTLFVLSAAGVEANDPAYMAGVQFLLKTQQDDGSWFVETRSRPVQVFFDNGDPHGKSQFISIPATAWAVAALARAL
jgi:N-acyl-D-amino-acid deacylase